MKKITIVIIILITALVSVTAQQYIRLVKPQNGWNSQRMVVISGETNTNEKAVNIVYNGIPLRLPVHGGRFSREFVAAPGLNSIYAEAYFGEYTATDSIAFYSQAPPKAMKIILMWDTDGTDVDLWVIEPTGEKCYYGNPNSQIGGTLDVDVTTGYGPEVYTLAAPTKGVYKIMVKYYSDNGYPQSEVKVYVVMYEGTPEERTEIFETMLTQTGREVVIDTVSLE